MFWLKEILGLLGMGMLSMSIVEDEVGADDKVDDKDDKADDGGKDKAPTIEALQAQLKQLGDVIAEKDRHIQKTDGIMGELKQTREQLRELKEFQEKVKDKAEEAGIPMPDGEYPTWGELKAVLKQIDAKYEKQHDEKFSLLTKIQSDERLANDEERMMSRKDLEIPYEEAMGKFLELAKEDDTLWEQVTREKFKPGGKPAQLAYKIALREHPDLIKKIKQKSREEVVDSIARGEDMPKRLGGGGGGGKIDYSKMTQQEIAKLPKAEFDALMKEIG